MSETRLKSSPGLTGEKLKETIEEGVALATIFGDELEGTRKMLDSLKTRLENERFHLAVLGQFKRGKSTFLNALIGAKVLPSSVVPLTAIPTFLKTSDRLEISVTFQNGKTERIDASSPDEARQVLEEYVTEEKNPKNEKAVSQVEVAIPSSILGRSVVLIDTPGIGSTFKHNTEATLNFLAECDAALFMVSADPPITEVEIEFLKEVKKKVSRLFFVINKVDYLDEDERSQIKEFITDVLRDQAGVSDVQIFLTSARDGLKARQAGDEILWEKSGMGIVESFLVEFLAREKERVFVEAISRKAHDVMLDIQMRLNLLIKSYLLPIEELEEKTRIFDEKLKEIERQKITFDDMISGERKRTVEFLEKQAESLRSEAREFLERVVDETIARCGSEKNLDKRVRDAISESIPGYFERLLGEMSRKMEDRITEALTPFEQKADELIGSIRKTAAELFDIPYRTLEGASRFVVEKEPYWVTHKWSASLSFVPEGAADALLPPGIRKGRVKKRMMKHVEELVLHNVENLRWVTLQNIDNTFRKFTSALASRMEEALKSTRGAMDAAMKKRLERAEVTKSEEEKLTRALEKIESLIEELNTSR